jgi:hypothetical protein
MEKVVLLAFLAGCAHVKPETGEVWYLGTAEGAVKVLSASDERPYDLAESAMDKGMSTGLTRDAQGHVRFWAGNGYGYGATTMGDGTVAPTGYYAPGQGLVPTPGMGRLPALGVHGTSDVSNVESMRIVPCPTDRSPKDPHEQAACAVDNVGSLMSHRVKP